MPYKTTVDKKFSDLAAGEILCTNPKDTNFTNLTLSYTETTKSMFLVMHALYVFLCENPSDFTYNKAIEIVSVDEVNSLAVAAYQDNNLYYIVNINRQ